MILHRKVIRILAGDKQQMVNGFRDANPARNAEASHERETSRASQVVAGGR
jgi:hypothetical protein